MSKHYIIPVFVPHFGCPHDCIFCNQKKITNVSTTITSEEVESTINKYLGYFRPNSFIEVAFYGGSFTAIDMDIQKELLEVPLKYKEKGLINEIRLSTRPDAISKEILDNLAEYKVDTIELGVQSLDESVLMASGRGHGIEDVYHAVDMIKSYRFKLGLQMMVGLPEDELKKSLATAKEFIKLEPDCVRIYPTLVIKDTYLEKLMIKDKYKPLTISEAIDISTIILAIFKLNNINVIRVGLQPTENIQLGKDVVAGPFHPAFRQLVEANIYKLILDYYFESKQIETLGKILEISAHKKIISNIAGQKSHNIKYWIDKYGFKKIKINAKDIELDRIFIKIDNHYRELDLNLLLEDCILDNLSSKNSTQNYRK